MDKTIHEAVLHFTISNYDVITPGSFVICCVTGKRITLENLRYWNAARQEAYADAASAFQRERELAAGK